MSFVDNRLAAVAGLSVEAFDYLLPEERIARQPLLPPEAAKLLISKKGGMVDATFAALPEWLPAESTLLVNNSKVVHARIPMRRATGGTFQLFLLAPAEPPTHAQALATTSSCVWSCLLGHAKRWKVGEPAQPCAKLPFRLTATRLESPNQHSLVRFEWEGHAPFAELIANIGQMPIPPYLNREATPEDDEWYQTVYAREQGSVAAPTAGLHLSNELIARITAANHRFLETTLHVSAATFLPVKSRTMGQHPMHSEAIVITDHLLEALLETKGPIIPVGTTALRTLESIYWLGAQRAATPRGPLPTHVGQWEPYQTSLLPPPTEALNALLEGMRLSDCHLLVAATQLLIAPPYRMQLATGLITNFHQPQSTLLLLVAAMLGPAWREAYQHALAEGYRFLSYGDGMLILP